MDPALNDVICKAIARLARDRTRSAAELLERLRHPRETAGSEADEDASPSGPRHSGVARLIAALVLTTLTSLAWLSHRADSRLADDDTATTTPLGAAATKRAAR